MDMTKLVEREELCMRIRKIILDSLMLEIPVEFISNDQPLVGRGFEFDSIDTLEISVAVEMEFDVSISNGNFDTFGSINKIVDYIMSAKEVRGV